MHLLLPPIAFATVLFLASSVSNANPKKIYEDDFSGKAGTLLSGRAPNIANTTGNTYLATATLELDGAGHAVSTSGGGVASIALPTITKGEVITVTALIRPVSTASLRNWIAIGFSPNATAGLPEKGVAWAFLRGGPKRNEKRGFLSVFPGPGTDSMKVYESSKPEPGTGSSTQLTLSYAVSTGKLAVTIGTYTVFDDVISYGGQASTPAPYGDLKNVVMQWFQQGTPGTPPAGWIESFSVSIAKGDAAAP